MRMRPVPVAMTSVRGLGPLPALIEAHEGPGAVQTLFRRLGLTPDVARSAERMIPLRDMVALFDLAAKITGRGLIGIETGRAMGDGFGMWARYARSAPTLGECLARIRRGLAFHQSGGRVHIDTTRPSARLAYHVPIGRPQWRAQHVEHTIPPLIEAMRLYLGPGWTPDRLEVDYPSGRRIAALEDALGTAVEVEMPAVALRFPREALEARRLDPVAEPPLSFHDLRDIVRSRPPATLAGAVAHVVGANIAEGGADLAFVAGQCGMSARTLQRRLDQEGASFTAVVDAVRLRHAKRLLQRPDLPMTEIAFRLGYSDPAHFTRAFRRLAKITPTHYRRTAPRG